MLRERRRAANFKPNRRLDRKSSRGMIYENEELRLRTININAEVERGQSDIRKLRRENEQLRREIWSLRDEYDRLDKLLRSNRQHGGSGGGGGGGDDQDGCCGEDDQCCSCSHSEGEENEEEDGDEDGEEGSGDESCDDENCNCQKRRESTEESAADNDANHQKMALASAVKVNSPSIPSTSTASTSKLRENLHVNFDHLSIVSEENLTGSDAGSNSLQVPGGSGGEGRDPSMLTTAYGKEMISLPATPCSPLLNDFQSIVPPLKHFESINYDDIGPPSPTTITSQPSSSTSALIPASASTSIQEQIAESAANSSWDNWTTATPTVSFSTFRSPNQPTKPPIPPDIPLPPPPGQQGEIVKISPTPKHFFSPIKSTNHLLPNSPDLYVHDVLASDSTASALPQDPIYAAVHKPPPLSNSLSSPSQSTLPLCMTQPTISRTLTSSPILVGTPKNCPTPTSFKVGGNLDELLQDIEAVSQDIEGFHLSSTPPPPPMSQDPAADRIVVEATTSAQQQQQHPESDLTPPPKIPEPMTLLPATLPYLDFKSSCAVISPSDSMVNHAGHHQADGSDGLTTATASKLASSTAAVVRRKFFGRKSKDNKKDNEEASEEVQLRLKIPQTDQQQNATDKPAEKVQEHRKASRRVSLSFGKKTDSIEQEKDNASAENANNMLKSSNAVKNPIHRVSSGADISSISTSIGSPSTPTTIVKANTHHHHHHHHRKDSKRGRKLMNRVSSDSQNIYSTPHTHPNHSHGHHHHHHHNNTDSDGRRNSAFHEPLTTSMSERNSNSLASSRESSTSLSMRSQKSRRISISSHVGGKIPWCGCWGNGCL